MFFHALNRYWLGLRYLGGGELLKRRSKRRRRTRKEKSLEIFLRCSRMSTRNTSIDEEHSVSALPLPQDNMCGNELHLCGLLFNAHVYQEKHRKQWWKQKKHCGLIVTKIWPFVSPWLNPTFGLFLPFIRDDKCNSELCLWNNYTHNEGAPKKSVNLVHSPSKESKAVSQYCCSPIAK